MRWDWIVAIVVICGGLLAYGGINMLTFVVMVTIGGGAIVLVGVAILVAPIALVYWLTNRR